MSRRALIGSLIAAAATVALGALPVAAVAGSGEYTLLQCHDSSRAAGEALAATRGSYLTQDRCAQDDFRLQITNGGFASAGQTGVWRFSAPGGSVITGLRLAANLRRDRHHLAQVVVVDDAGSAQVLVNGPDTGEGFIRHVWSELSPKRAVILHLYCSQSAGCQGSDVAHAYARNIEIQLEDVADPEIANVSGSLLAGGWLRGSHSLTAQASDQGSGLQSLTASVNGVEVARAPITCTGWLGENRVNLFSPCPVAPANSTLSPTLTTESAPFVDGANAIRVCAADFSVRTAACIVRTAHIDNAPPQLAFADLDSEDPELIRVSAYERHSGISDGQILFRAIGATEWQPLTTQLTDDDLTARIDSSSFPPGDYEFLSRARDVAGNAAETSLRADGQPMVARFPLRAPVDLVAHLEPSGASAQTIDYGTDAAVAGRLMAPDGTPLPNAEVTVEEYFGAGALIDRRVRTVVTGPDGSWSGSLPAGPSRSVTVSYSGSRRYRPADAYVGEMKVRGRATFNTSRKSVPEGGRIVFKGRVDHLGARIPAGGKLVELQVQESAGRWNTVREAFHTGPDGAYRVGYRFGRFYQSDARFRFRVKVAREQGWPYEGPARTRSRAVIVKAR